MRTKSVELVVGIVGIVVGLVGIYATVLQFPGALDAVGSVLTGSGLPPAFKGLAGGTTIFAVILGGIVALAALYVGLSSLTALIFGLFSTPMPVMFGFLTIGWFFWLSFLITLYMYFFEAAFFLSILTFLGGTILTMAAILHATGNMN